MSILLAVVPLALSLNLGLVVSLASCFALHQQTCFLSVRALVTTQLSDELNLLKSLLKCSL